MAQEVAGHLPLGAATERTRMRKRGGLQHGVWRFRVGEKTSASVVPDKARNEYVAWWYLYRKPVPVWPTSKRSSRAGCKNERGVAPESDERGRGAGRY